MRLQSRFPEKGSICVFAKPRLTCLVVSNYYGNRAVVLQVQDADWFGAYIILTYCFLPGLLFFMPKFVMCIIDSPQDGRITRSYFMSRQEMGGAQYADHISATRIYKSMMFFDDMARRCHYVSFKNAHTKGCLSVPDWRFTTSRIAWAVVCIQSQWRKCIASPSYTMCVKRLMLEYQGLNTTLAQ